MSLTQDLGTKDPLTDTDKFRNMLKKVTETPSQAISQTPLSPTTTEQEDITLAGQRNVNLIWEWSQAVIAVTVVIGNVFVAMYQGLKGITTDFPQILSNSLFLVIGFYFSRTNHQAIGGVGRKANEGQAYTGR